MRVALTGIFAVDMDNCYAKSDDDDMSWTGRVDKQLFALLSLSNNGICLCGRKTYDVLPTPLKGRTIICLQNNNLLEKCHEYPHANIIGGKQVLMSAFKQNLIDTFFLMRIPLHLNSNLQFDVNTYLPSDKLVKKYEFQALHGMNITVSAFKGLGSEYAI